MEVGSAAALLCSRAHRAEALLPFGRCCHSGRAEALLPFVRCCHSGRAAALLSLAPGTRHSPRLHRPRGGDPHGSLVGGPGGSGGDPGQHTLSLSPAPPLSLGTMNQPGLCGSRGSRHPRDRVVFRTSGTGGYRAIRAARARTASPSRARAARRPRAAAPGRAGDKEEGRPAPHARSPLCHCGKAAAWPCCLPAGRRRTLCLASTSSSIKEGACDLLGHAQLRHETHKLCTCAARVHHLRRHPPPKKVISSSLSSLSINGGGICSSLSSIQSGISSSLSLPDRGVVQVNKEMFPCPPSRVMVGRLAPKAALCPVWPG